MVSHCEEWPPRITDDTWFINTADEDTVKDQVPNNVNNFPCVIIGEWFAWRFAFRFDEVAQSINDFYHLRPESTIICRRRLEVSKQE